MSHGLLKQGATPRLERTRRDGRTLRRWKVISKLGGIRGLKYIKAIQQPRKGGW